MQRGRGATGDAVNFSIHCVQRAHRIDVPCARAYGFLAWYTKLRYKMIGERGGGHLAGGLTRSVCPGG